MYSPLQEVPSTPALLSNQNVLKRLAGTSEAVVPDVPIHQSQDESVSVPGTPATSAVLSSPWTPNARSLTRTQKGRRYTYNPLLASRFLPMSPAVAASPKEQVVPSTPIGGFLYPKTPDSVRRENVTKTFTTRFGSGEYIDAAGDRPRKRHRMEKENKTVVNNNNNTAPNTPRLLRSRSQREVVARFRSSPEATQTSGDAVISQDFLDLI